MEIKNVGVIGAGLMGTGIVQVVAEAGYKTFWVDIGDEQLRKGLEGIKRLLNRKKEKGKCDDTYIESVLSNIEFSAELANIAKADLIIEAVPENMDLKTGIFKQLDGVTESQTILASNTSGLSVTALGAATRRPEKVIGTHFFYPAPVMALLEVIPGLLTAQDTIETIKEFGLRIGKSPVICNDYPGFVVNRLLIPMVNEAIYLVMEGVKSEDIDTAMKLGANHPMGPIALADFVGLDTLLATMEGLYQGFNDSKYRPCPLLVKMVESGKLGRKTGRGFYRYDN